MAATGHFYKTSDNVGAPALTQSAGSLIAVLDWVLDVGTGTHWEKVFSGTNKAVYRATAGQRYYFRVDDTIGEVARIEGYETMSDVDTGTGKFPGAGHELGYVSVPKIDDPGNADYVYAGDSRFFVGVHRHDNAYSNVSHPYGFGEINGVITADAYHTAIFGASISGTNAAWNIFGSDGITEDVCTPGINAAVSPSSSSIHFVKSYDGLVDQPAGFLLSMGKGSNNSTPGLESSVNPAFALHPFYVHDYAGNANGDSPATFRGHLPYIYLGNMNPGSNFTYGNELTLDGSDFFIATFQTSSTFSATNACPYYIRKTDDEPGRV